MLNYGIILFVGKLDQHEQTAFDLGTPTDDGATGAFHTWEARARTRLNGSMIIRRLNEIAPQHIGRVWDVLADEIGTTKQNVIAILNADGFFVWKQDGQPPPLFDQKSNHAVVMDGYFFGGKTDSQKRMASEIVLWLDKVVDEFRTEKKDRTVRGLAHDAENHSRNLLITAYRLVDEIVYEEEERSGTVVDEEPLRRMARMHMMQRLNDGTPEWAADQSINIAKRAICRKISELYLQSAAKARELAPVNVQRSEKLLLLESDVPFAAFERAAFASAAEAVTGSGVSDSWSKLPDTSKRLILLEMLQAEGCELVNIIKDGKPGWMRIRRI